MTALWLLAGAFGAVIAAGAVAVAINDAVERWFAARRAHGCEGGGGRPAAAPPVQRHDVVWSPRPVVAARPPTRGRAPLVTVGRLPTDRRVAGSVRRSG